MFLLGIFCFYYGISDVFRIGDFGEFRTTRYLWFRPLVGEVTYELRTFGSSFWDWFQMIILIGVGIWLSSVFGKVIYDNDYE